LTGGRHVRPNKGWLIASYGGAYATQVLRRLYALNYLSGLATLLSISTQTRSRQPGTNSICTSESGVHPTLTNLALSWSAGRAGVGAVADGRGG